MAVRVWSVHFGHDIEFKTLKKKISVCSQVASDNSFGVVIFVYIVATAGGWGVEGGGRNKRTFCTNEGKMKKSSSEV